MPGTPVWRAARAKIDAAGGAEYICARIADGASVTEVAEELGLHRNNIARYIRRAGTDAERRYEEAKRERAHALADEALAIVDAPAADNVEVSRAKNRADVRKWLASVLNREDYGREANQSPTVSIQNLHLNALLTHGKAPAIAPAQAIEDAEYEDAEYEEVDDYV